MSNQIFKNKNRLLIIFLMLWIFFILMVPEVQASSCRILVVMSYEENNPWCSEIKEGIDSVLSSRCDIQYFYMDTKINFKGGNYKAQEAYKLYKRFRPDGVIAADDNAQSMFVLPYLKDKVKTPVMFCAVNEKPEKYGYPASNVSGILERNFIRESIAFAKQLVPSIKTVGYLAKESPSGRAIKNQVEIESDTYLAKFAGFKLVKTIKETLAVLEEYEKTSDALFVDATNGILDTNGQPLDNERVTKIIAKSYQKPLIGANDFHVQYGVLCAVVKSGQTQGRIAAEMLAKSIDGTPVSQIPIEVNKYGKRMLNVSVMQSLGIRPKRRAIIGAELIKTTE
jgi:ABC-type uncharacterized transport system substrate-binding protein